MAGLVGYSGDEPGAGSTKKIQRDVYSVTFAVGALTASVGDATALGLLWAKRGDVFTWNPTQRLDGVAMCDISCDTNGTLTGRFVGTTAGGNYVVDVCRTTAP
jgi:hypothetical protein